MKYLFLTLFIGLSFWGQCQILPNYKATNWSYAGLESNVDQTTFVKAKASENGFANDGITDNTTALNNLFSTFIGQGLIIQFDSGNYVFNSTIKLPSNTIIKGLGANKTTLTIDLNGAGNAIEIAGTLSKKMSSSLTSKMFKNSTSITINSPEIYQPNEWLKLSQNDSDWVTSSWALGSVGQIFKVKSIKDSTIFLTSIARMSYELNRKPIISSIVPKANVGIECLKINRIDNTAPSQNSNLYFSYAVNCWVKGIESVNCTFAHIDVRNSSNLSISNSYFHDAFEHGTGGRAYGVMLQSTTNECLVENNVFKRLRHSMIVQSGANGNVFSLNYSTDIYWDLTPSDGAGDMVLHGNYVFLNLFEQNICRNIVIDDSHGPNGKYNTFYRNRAEGYGIFFSAANSPYQNFIGNEIPNKSFPYSLANYTIQGSNHFLYGNNDKGTIKPSGTDSLADTSFYYMGRPSFIEEKNWISLGTPNVMGTGSNRAQTAFINNTIMNNACDTTVINDNTGIIDLIADNIQALPTPFQDHLNIKSKNLIQSVRVYNSLGVNVAMQMGNNNRMTALNTSHWKAGIYYIEVIDNKSQVNYLKSIKL